RTVAKGRCGCEIEISVASREMKTRTLLLLSLACAVAILGAGVGLMWRLGGSTDAEPTAPIGQMVTVGDLEIQVSSATLTPVTLSITMIQSLLQVEESVNQDMVGKLKDTM
ncbi:MAG: hypothetical protein EBT18_04445, partial [Gammaproteobacteria bacterium]|nr:hypothetical protein [Gammaproteobacteria bacterium]